MRRAEDYVPASGHHLPLRFYDALAWLMGAGPARRRLEVWIGDGSPRRVLEVGCGTGSLLLRLGRWFPEAEIRGLDPDLEALAAAGRKARRARMEPRLEPMSEAVYYRAVAPGG